MAQGLEVYDTSVWINSVLSVDGTLSAAATGGFHDGVAPPGTLYPFVRWSVQSPPRVIRGAGKDEFYTDGLWLVVAVDNNASNSKIGPMSGRIQALLGGVINVATGSGIILACVREDGFTLPQVEGGREYRSMGGIYRVKYQ